VIFAVVLMNGINYCTNQTIRILATEITQIRLSPPPFPFLPPLRLRLQDLTGRCTGRACILLLRDIKRRPRSEAAPNPWRRSPSTLPPSIHHRSGQSSPSSSLILYVSCLQSAFLTPGRPPCAPIWSRSRRMAMGRIYGWGKRHVHKEPPTSSPSEPWSCWESGQFDLQSRGRPLPCCVVLLTGKAIVKHLN
jgi:hypothetical protein